MVIPIFPTGNTIFIIIAYLFSYGYHIININKHKNWTILWMFFNHFFTIYDVFPYEYYKSISVFMVTSFYFIVYILYRYISLSYNLLLFEYLCCILVFIFNYYKQFQEVYIWAWLACIFKKTLVVQIIVQKSCIF